MMVPDGMDPLEEDVRYCESCAIDEIERLQEEIACLRPTGRSAVYDDYVATVQLVTEFHRHGSLEARVRALSEDRQRLRTELDAANTRFAEMNTPTGREIELQVEVGRLQAMATKETERCMEIEAIVDWLPKDAEGNAVYPGRALVSTYYGTIQQPRMVIEVWRDGWTLGGSSKYMANDPGRQCYGSIEAAEKARQSNDRTILDD